MSASRQRILAEMGIKPLWRLREAASSGQEASAAVPESLPDLAPADPLPATPKVEARPIVSAGAAVPRPESATPAVPRSEQATALALDWPELEETVANCRKCRLCERRKQAVFGVGDRNAEWMLVGEGPGAEEDQRGEPFVGQAGRLLDSMLASVGLRRGENVYIANAVKCRPPGNRTPEADEMAACRPYLERQIELVRPRLIVAMGRPAAQTLLETEVKVGASRGRMFAYHDIPVIVTYHPAYLLRNLADKAKAWEDLCFATDQFARLKAGTGQ